MTALVFVYGTLKEGFPNFHVNLGSRVPGEFETVQAYPLFIVGDSRVPWLVDRPGEGQPVAGELYRVGGAELALMDELEQVDEPGWYARRTIAVRPRGQPDGEGAEAFVYFGNAARLLDTMVHEGPMAEYTARQARGYRDGGL
jgi:gamma-glutamylaminecyclotransferase